LFLWPIFFLRKENRFKAYNPSVFLPDYRWLVPSFSRFIVAEIDALEKRLAPFPFERPKIIDADQYYIRF
jgi:hypothetical protein